MTTCVYKVEFSKSSFDLNEDYEYLSEREKEWISQLDAESYFDYDSPTGYICFVITNPIEMGKYLDILNKNYIWNHCQDLSKQILSSQINLSEELNHIINSFNSIKWSFFIEDLDDWILENLDIDTVLDRISEVGIDFLKPIEKDFLKNYHL
jgi:hypothetical protein